MDLLRVRSLQSKILILFIFLLVVVQSVSFYSTYRASQKLESTHLSNRIKNAIDVFQTQINSRRYYLSAFAETAAKDYGLKSILQEDQKSILVALNNHRKRINSDLALAIDEQGVVFAQLETYTNSNDKEKVRVGSLQGKSFLTNRDTIDDNDSQLVLLDNKLYQLSLAPLKSGARNIGWLGFGYLIDEELATELAALTEVHIAFVVKSDNQSQVLSSSITSQYPTNSPFFDGLLDKTENSYIYHESPIGMVDSQQIVTLLFKSKADVLETVGVQWPRLALLVLLTVVLSVLSAVAIAKSITNPIRKLIRQVKEVTAGNYDSDVTVDGSVEIKQLSDDFNQMTKAIVLREETISFQAFHDALTHLPNRNALLNELINLERHNKDYVVIQLCFLDAEHITDTLGYKIGDQIIQHVAQRVTKTSVESKNYHLGREHFVLIVEDQDVDHVLNTLLSEVSIQCEFDNISLHIQYVAGVAVSKLHRGDNPSELLQKTNVALQHAKKHKRLYQVYEPQFDTNALERLFLSNNLKNAIESDELVLFYQPKLNLETMTISHVEALVRWEHPERGLIPPDSFISIAEQTGQMPALTRWVTKQAVTQYNIWQQQGLDISIAINIAPENILDNAYPDFVIDLKKTHNLSDDAITLEVTEDAIVEEPEIAHKVLIYLREHGFKLSIDDFGTGYSSLGQLKLLPVQELKVDRSFVQNLAVDESDQIIVQSTVELAHNLGLSVVAEGIEDETALTWLKKLGCEFAQGYFISKPLPPHLFDKWVANSLYDIRKTED
ncbi:MAG: EAL domain-containing protein [Gammaproteobacteria bacterium]|nr:EAL domain-containing protein [Gammaproteobacteria bacterium]